MRSMTPAIAAALTLAAALPAQAADPAACQTVRLSDPGWTDITSTNAVASVLLEGLGYQPRISTLSVPVGYQAMKSGDLDAFLGNWMPAQQHFRDDLEQAGSVDVLTRNLEGAKFTLAVTKAAADAGVKDFSDLAPHAREFGSTIYGIEPGAPANQNIQKMVDANDFGLGSWRLIESGEQAMLSQVARNDGQGKFSVFLAWAPHPMNETLDITYLSGGDEYFGPNYGGAEVFTLARKAWVAECPNAARFLTNLVFNVSMENQIMGRILNDNADPKAAATDWIKANPDALGPWLEGVMTRAGEPGLAAVRKALAL
ncbi:choline ABC transporter substrate-binding protein [Haematobacter genomosp. 1]|uniref:Glycine/betaine ABC transporter substrate-binding protein n=1 Tax=Haematobacter genomosp. 1 TaxID=366618 RepID=A0A212AFK9_9RHOB|nr:choline ABC transporter substrate-binding protein [Haematobacter genomosp. 1]OWJ80219.1 glycine/betaine ABC transporter substrate-binding protein [Haematobacter genomosp. 1]